MDYIYHDLQKIHGFKDTGNIAKKYMRTIDHYMDLCKKFNFKLNYIGLEKIKDINDDSVSYVSFEFERK